MIPARTVSESRGCDPVTDVARELEPSLPHPYQASLLFSRQQNSDLVQTHLGIRAGGQGPVWGRVTQP